jgi:hypothetical protein
MRTGEHDRDRFRRSGNAVSARVLDETVILDLDHDRYTRLNGSAGLLWEELAEPRTPAELADRLVSEYGIDAERARADAERLLSKLRAGGLLEKAV